MALTKITTNIIADNAITADKIDQTSLNSAGFHKDGDEVSFGNITTSGYLRGPASFIIDPAAHGDDTGSVSIKGDLVVEGTTFTANATTVDIADINLTIAHNAPNPASADGAGITIDGANATMLYSAADDTLVFNKDVDVTGTVTADNLTVDGSGTITNTSAGVTTALSLKNNTLGDDNRVALDFYTASTKYVTLEGGYGITSPEFNVKVGNTPKLVMKAISGGDVAFYDAAGTSEKFLWDATAQSVIVTALDNVTTTYPINIANSAGSLTTGYGAYGLAMPAGSSYTMDINGDLILDTGGNVGIGTGNPLDLLHINSDTGDARQILDAHTGFDSELKYAAGGNVKYTTGYDSASDSFVIGTINTNTEERLVINNVGNVGINNTTPEALLHIGPDPLLGSYTSTRTTLAVADEDNGAELILRGQSPRIWLDSTQGGIGELYMDNTAFNILNSSPDASNTSRLYINNTGNVGINKTDPETTLDVAGTIKADQNIINAISEVKGDTAVDVFVYDTRKDSDGGAWRKRTQHTSWYNETLNTATRGSRREFPAVAIIVAEATTVTIYDGDDPSMPMWMVFDQSEGTGYTGWTMLLGGDNDATEVYDQVTSVSALNGIIATGVTDTPNSVWGGCQLVNFITDEGYKITKSDSVAYTGKFPHPIAGREIGLADNEFVVSDYSTIINQNVNDIAMTVLPNAPIDSATGLPIPTIALATDGGVSIIKDDGSVVNIVPLEATSITLDSTGRIWYQVGTSTSVQYFGSIPNSDVSYTARDGYYNQTTNGTPSIPVTTITALASYNVGSLLGVFRYAEEVGNESNGMVNYITSKYNTGWMHGNIKLATLSDTDATDITGTELVTNGTFDTDYSGWSEYNLGTGSPTYAISGGELQITLGGSYDVGVDQEISGFVVGETYSVSFDTTVTSNLNAGNVFHNSIGTAAGASDGASIIQEGLVLNTTDTASATFTATSTTYFLRIRTGGGGNTQGSYKIDNVSVRLAEEDRSVNNNGLQVFGTVTKTPVATGADLVAYSGFTLSNYLEQPYNSDLDFGTDDFCVMGWFKFETPTTGLQRLWQRGASPTSGSFSGGGQIQLRLNANGKLGTYVSDDNYVSYDTMETGQRVDDNVWHLVTLVRAGVKLMVYIDGKVSNGVNVLYAAGSLSNTEATTMIGLGQDFALPNTGGKQALWRASASAPTAKQIEKIYNDEKVLFQENAKATLYGTSDAVTALAYDEDTELLHVGTSEGRSVFQGLRRVDNTTDAVASSISASNGIVVED